MIGKLTELSLDATFFALTNEQLAWPQTPEEFTRLREEANRLLAKMEIGERVPETHEKYLEERNLLNDRVLSFLAAERQRILGDTIALPLFFLHSMTYRVTVKAPLGLDWEQDREIIEACLDDLGLPVRTIDHLERELGWMFVRTEDDGEVSIARADAIRVGGSFLQRVWEEFARKEDGIDENKRISELLGEVRSDIREFRDEYREDARRLTDLLHDRDSEVVAVVNEIQKRLTLAGIAEAEAVALTEKDPEKFWDRITKWASGAPWADAAEEALWAALDFVPGGIGVKLGIKVAREVRKALKKKR